jgi:thiosulfate dehydrogenase
MNCQNCHLNAGTVYFGNCLSAVASTYPVFRARSGVVESVEFRVNDCLKRSLNGHPIDSQSREMRALVAYMEWLGKDVPEEVKPKGANTVEMPYLDRAADPEKGRQVYISRCQRCHGSDGQGSWKPDHTAFIYPPLWGDNSYNTGAGLYRLSRFANYVKYNMPNDSAAYPNAILTDEQAWDVAAFVNSQPRPDKRFPEDWPDISKKSIDHPYGPYTDGFSETQHKYGPFGPIKEARKNLAGK